MHKETLLLIADSFPNGGDDSFLIPEIPFLEENFSITIVSPIMEYESLRISYTNIPTYRIGVKLSALDFILGLTQFLTDVLCWKELFNVLKTREKVVLRGVNSFSCYVRGRKFFKQLQKLQVLDNLDIVYSYWYNYKLIGVLLGMRRWRKKPRVLSRTHGYDLYNERVDKTGRQPFRPLADNYLQALAFVSNFGYDYYKETFGFSKNCNYIVSRLGVRNDFGLAPYEKSKVLRIVSCSNIIPIKRVELIMEALALITEFHVMWTHLGDGTMRKAIAEKCTQLFESKDNISYKFLGALANVKVHEFYQTNSVDVFITTSSTEGGCPVTIQEAFSYGVPVIGTKAGGITKLFEYNKNGILLPQNPAIEEIAASLSTIHAMKNSPTYALMRKEVHSTWLNEFNAEINYQKFVDLIKNLQPSVLLKER